MKKIVVTLLLAAILLAMTPMSATLAEASYATVQSGNQYGVRLRLGPGTNYAKTGKFTGKGVFSIVEEASGQGASLWGRLKSGAGWISLDYAART